MKRGARLIARESGAKAILALLFLLLLAGFNGSAMAAETGRASDALDFWRIPDFSAFPIFLQRTWAERTASGWIESMEDEEILAQVLMVGYEGVSPSPSLLRWVESRGLGGVKIFGWNAEDTTALAKAIAAIQNEALDREASIPVLVATDQEGGWIRHVKGRTSESPGNMAIGATGQARDAYLAGFHIGEELRVLGITMNFAPDIDLATNPESAIIGPRAFSDDPALVARLGLAWARGSLAAGVIPTAKHYPGHGATPLDSHGSLPLIDIDKATFLRRELFPFESLVRGGIPAIMSGHLAFPRVAGDSKPASLSAALIKGYLRDRLGYKGLVITDDLYMVGALGSNSILDTCVDALMAGNDMILLSVPPESDGALWKGLLDRYRKDEDFRRSVREAAGRVLTLKMTQLRPLGREGLLPDAATVASRLPDPQAQAFFKDLARRSVSLVGDGSAIPFPSKAQTGGRIILAAPFDTFLSIGKRKYPGASAFQFSYRPENSASKAELEAFRAALKGKNAAIVCVANRAGMQFASAAQEAGVEVAIISVLSPVLVRHSSWAKAIVAVYHYAPSCLEAGFDALQGKIPAKGRLPLSAKAMR